MILHKFCRLLILAAAFIMAACSSKPTNSLEDNNLRSKVKSVTERQYIALQDFEGVRRGDPYRPGENEWDVKMNFNKEGYMVEYIQLSIGGDDTVWATSLVYDSVKTHLKTLEITDNAEGEVVRYEITHYNADDKPDTITTTDAFGRPLGIVHIAYLRNGKRQEKRYFSANGNLNQREVLLMDGDYPIAVQMFDGEGQPIVSNHFTWKNGLRDSVTIVENRRVVARIGFDYDYKGNLVSQHGVNGEGVAIKQETYSYEYDNRGNWVRRVYRVDGKPFYMTERTIEYYPEDK